MSMRCLRLLRLLGASTAAVLAPSSTLGASGPSEAPLPSVMAEAAALRATWSRKRGELCGLQSVGPLLGC